MPLYCYGLEKYGLIRAYYLGVYNGSQVTQGRRRKSKNAENQFTFYWNFLLGSQNPKSFESTRVAHSVSISDHVSPAGRIPAKSGNG